MQIIPRPYRKSGRVERRRIVAGAGLRERGISAAADIAGRDGVFAIPSVERMRTIHARAEDMAWSNGPLTVYHGTDHRSAAAIRSQGIDRRKFRNKTDFGAGFYVTTVLRQAEQWANRRCRPTAALHAEVLQYDISRARIETLTHLTFVVDNNDYYDFVEYCRSGGPHHGPARGGVPYEIVYGPVSLGRQKLVIANCDQMSFSDPSGLADFNSPVKTLYPVGGGRFF